MGGANAHLAQQRAKAIAAQKQAEATALANYKNKIAEYAKSKGVTIPSDLLAFATPAQLGVGSKEILAYYAPNKLDKNGDPVKGRGYLSWEFSRDSAAKNSLTTNPSALVDKFLADPGKYYANAITDAVFHQNIDAAKAYIKEAQTPAYNIPVSTLQNAINTGNDRYRQMQETNAAGNPFIDALAGVALAYALPGIGTFLATELGVSAAVGTALASTAVQVAQGASFEDALKNATVNAVVNTGSTSVATEINNVIKNPAVTDAVVSAGASAVKTAAAGGSASDIANNIGAAIAGSATASATGSNLAGSTVGGAVSGGVTGALSGAASALGTDAAKPKDTTTPATTTSGTTLDPATQQLVTAIQKEQATPSPSTELGKVADVTSNVPGYVTDTGGGGALLNLPAAGISAGGPEPVAPNVDVNATQSGTPTLGDTKQDVLQAITSPKTTDITTTGGYTPTITTTPSPIVTPTTSPVSADKPILDLIAPTSPVTTPTTTPTTAGTTTPSTPVDTAAPAAPTTPVTQTTTQPPAAVSEQDKKMLDLISPPPATTTETPAVPPTAPDQVLPEVVATATQDKTTTTPSTDTKTDTEAPLPVDVAKEELPPEEVTADPTKPADKYKPNLRIYGGTTPSTLSQSLGTGGTYSTGVATTGLTGSRGAGEIESKETGKKRKNVWNEASLRLKDALGV